MTSKEIAGVIGVFKGIVEAGWSTDYQYRRGIGFGVDMVSVIDSILYSGAQSSAYNGFNFIINYLISNIRGSDYYLFDNTLSQLLNAAKWFLQKDIFNNIEIEVAKLVTISEKHDWNLSIFSKIPARKAHIDKKSAAGNQHFQFFFRSLKPSIWKEDAGFVPAKAPKGILLLPSSIKNFSENYNASWNQQNILGNVQKIHKYQYTDRSISLTIDLFSHSLSELRYNIWRLNWLADHTYGNLSTFSKEPTKEDNFKFMQKVEFKEQPFIRATIGSVINELPCYINSLNINYHMDKPWAIGSDIMNRIKGSKELQYPHLITVTLALNVLYDVLDPTSNSYYTQDGSLERKDKDKIDSKLKYIEW